MNSLETENHLTLLSKMTGKRPTYLDCQSSLPKLITQEFINLHLRKITYPKENYKVHVTNRSVTINAALHEISSRSPTFILLHIYKKIGSQQICYFGFCLSCFFYFIFPSHVSLLRILFFKAEKKR